MGACFTSETTRRSSDLINYDLEYSILMAGCVIFKGCILCSVECCTLCSVEWLHDVYVEWLYYVYVEWLY